MRMRRLVSTAAVGLVAGLLPGLAHSTAQAAPAGDDLVIAEVYLNGGSSGATYRNKFVEVLNPTDETIDVSDWSVQYRSYSSTGAFTGVIALGEHRLPPGATLLVSGNANAANGAELPTPDVASNIAFSGNANGGTLALVRSTSALSGDRAAVLGDDRLVDLVGYGASATFEGRPVASGYSVTSALQRADGRDTDDNAADFAGGTPTPQACGEACDGAGAEPGDPDTVTIAAIQGEGAESPLAGRTVTTRAVVTAVYPTGGYRGVFVQTPGTGGEIDLATHRASHGLFVFSDDLAANGRIGDHVEITGRVSEYRGQTQITPTSWVRLAEPAEAVKPAAVAFGLDEAERESLEGMLLAPQGEYTVTNNYTTNRYAEIGIAAGDSALPQPTDVARPGTSEYAAVVADNAERLVTLDDGASIDFTGSGSGTPVPWLRPTGAEPTGQVRVGAPVTFREPVVLDFRNDLWKLQPTSPIESPDQEPVTIGATRVAAPAEVGGDVQIASFNVLNYFTTTGEAYEAAGMGACTYYTSRTGERITVNRCANDGPRGAATEASLARQEAKIVAAIDALGADVVSLEEIENSAAFGIDRDTALRRLVAALNEDAGTTEWAAVASPADVPEVEDVIRTAFIHRVDTVETVGESAIDDDPAFDNARDPLAQEFRPVGGDADDDFVVIVNHFKSKGSGTGEDADAGDGQGASNASRVRQAQALVDFAAAQQEVAGTDRVFLTGDFNAYSQEDPIQVLTEAGYVNVPAQFTDKTTYQFDGLVGSLDHVFASPAAADRVTGADIWDINADESIGREYSRYDNNVTTLYDESPFRASDHDPAIVGFDAFADDAEPAPTTIEVTGSTSVPRTSISVRIAAGDVLADGGTVTVRVDRRVVGTAQVRDGRVTVPVQGVGRAERTYTIDYAGDDLLGPATIEHTARL